MSLPEMNMRIRNFLRLVPLAAACVVFHAVPASAQDAAGTAWKTTHAAASGTRRRKLRIRMFISGRDIRDRKSVV